MARILLIDDEANIRMMVKMALEQKKHSVETADDGAQGLLKFGTGTGWDLVLLDHRMPGMDGIEVLKELRRRDPKCRVVMITAFGTFQLARTAIEAGATDFLRKPFTIEALRDSVVAALDRPRPSNLSQDEPVPFKLTMTTVNGYQIESVPGPGLDIGTELVHNFVVRGPAGDTHSCTVAVPAYVRELVRAYTDCERMPFGPRFWQAMCEEYLSEFVWHDSGLPPESGLRISEFTPDLKRWTDAVLGNSG